MEVTAGRIARRGLEGAVYPLNRSQLISVARENEAEPLWLTWLSQLPAREYASAGDVHASLLALTPSSDEATAEWSAP